MGRTRRATGSAPTHFLHRRPTCSRFTPTFPRTPTIPLTHHDTRARRACARARARAHTSISGPLRITLRSAQRESAHLPAYEYTGRAPRAEPGVQGSVRSAWQCTPQRQACKVYRLEEDALFFAPQIFQIWALRWLFISRGRLMRAASRFPGNSSGRALSRAVSTRRPASRC